MSPINMAQAWADSAILLDIFARHAGIDAIAEMRKKIALLREREWKPGPSGALYAGVACHRGGGLMDEVREIRHFHFLLGIGGSAKVSFAGRTPIGSARPIPVIRGPVEWR